MTDKIVIIGTCASREEAERMARTLVERRLAACVSIVPGIRSFYRWRDAIESADELLLIIKSSRALFGQLREALEGMHSYEVPEALALPVADSAPNYLKWMEESLRGE
jgi:periplasmic divalent cation tolerance protein